MKKILFAIIITTGSRLLAQSEGVFYKIEGKDLKGTCYLFGTFHLLNDGYLDDIPKVKNAFLASDKVVVETLIDSSQMIGYGEMMRSGENCEKYYSPSFKDSLDTELKAAAGIPLYLVGNLKPMALTAILINHYMNLAASDILDKYKGVPLDLYFASHHKNAGKKYVGLEDPEYQLRLLYNSQSAQNQATELHQMVMHKEEYIHASRQMLELYMKGDLEDLLNMNVEWDVMDKMMATLLDERNTDWLKQLPELMAEGNVFVAVGALHLTGKKGLVNALRELGYTVTPIPVK